jgi:WD40 repeat protein
MYHLTDTDEYRFPGTDAPYVLEVIPTVSGLVVTTTDQRVSLFNPTRLRDGPQRANHTGGWNIQAARVLGSQESLVAAAGEDGKIAVWDFRDSTGTPQVSFDLGSSRPMAFGAADYQANIEKLDALQMSYRLPVRPRLIHWPSG